MKPAGKPAAKKSRGVPVKSSSAAGGETGSLPAPSLSAPPPAAPAEDPPDNKNPATLWVQVQSEEAPEELWGDWGPAGESSSEEATFFDHCSRTPNRPVRVKANWLAVRTGPPSARGRERKNCLWLSPDQKELVLSQLSCSVIHKLCDGIPADDLTVPEKGAHTVLSQEQVDAGAWEVLWRLLPGRGVVVLPCALTSVVLEHGMLGPAEADKREAAEALRIYWMELAQKARLLLVPVFASGHWTMLALQRGDRVEPPPPSDAPEDPDASWRTKLCSKCRGDGCAECVKLKDLQQGDRKGQELFQMSVEAWPVEEESSNWECRYYETLDECKPASQAAADAVLVCLKDLGAPPQTLPSRSNVKRQSAEPCGYFLLH